MTQKNRINQLLDILASDTTEADRLLGDGWKYERKLALGGKDMLTLDLAQRQVARRALERWCAANHTQPTADAIRLAEEWTDTDSTLGTVIRDLDGTDLSADKARTVMFAALRSACGMPVTQWDEPHPDHGTPAVWVEYTLALAGMRSGRIDAQWRYVTAFGRLTDDLMDPEDIDRQCDEMRRRALMEEDTDPDYEGPEESDLFYFKDGVTQAVRFVRWSGIAVVPPLERKED